MNGVFTKDNRDEFNSTAKFDFSLFLGTNERSST